MIDRRVQLLVTTIVKVVVGGTPLPRSLAGSLPDRPFESRFGEQRSLAANDGHQRRVLVVDDEKLIADSVATILNRSGFTAIATYSGTDALESIQEKCPDIIVSDVVMPDFNGIQLAKAVRSLCPRARIVLFSGNVDTASLLDDASMEGYFFEILAKPIHPVELLKTLKS
jgi:DNA-binding NtrC family response regulator